MKKSIKIVLSVLIIGLVAFAVINSQNSNEVADMTVARVNPSLIQLSDNEVLVLGGVRATGDNNAPTAEVFNLNEKKFKPLEININIAKSDIPALKVGNNIIIVDGKSKSVYLYDSKNKTTLKVGELNVSRSIPSLVDLGDNKFLVVGGYDFTKRKAVKEIEVFDLTTKQSEIVGENPLISDSPLDKMQSLLLNDNRVLIIKTFNPQLDKTPAVIFDLKLNQSEEVQGFATSCRANKPMLLKDNKVLNLCTQDSYNGKTGAEVYDYQTRASHIKNYMVKGRIIPQANYLNDGQIIISGGTLSGKNLKKSALPNTIEVFNPSTETFEVVGKMNNAPRTYHGSIVLNNNQLLITGGVSKPSEPLKSALLY